MTAAVEQRGRASRSVERSGRLVGVTALVAAWAALAARQPELVLPSPTQTVSAMFDLAADGTLAAELATTVARAASAISIAVVLGTIWGVVNGASRWAMAISRPALTALMAVPPVVLVVVGLLWFGPGAATTRLVVILVAIPLMVVAVEEAVVDIDRDLLEMASSFDFGAASTVRHVVAPAIASPALAAVTVALGQSLRVAVMAELLSASTGVGAEIARSRSNLETADVFAWAFVLVAFAVVFEMAVLEPATRRLLRWRS